MPLSSALRFFWCVVWFHGICGIQTSRRVSREYICLNSGVILSILLHLPYPDRGVVWHSVLSVFTRLNPNFSGCRNRIFDFDIPALDLTSFEWTYVLPYARINSPFILPSICLKDMGKTELIREATCKGHISCCLRVLTIRKRGTYSQYSRRNLGSVICLASPHVRASVMDHGQEGRVCVTTHWP